VADLAGRVAPGPRLAVEHDAAAHAGAPEHAEDRRVVAAGAELELRVGRHLDVVAEPDRHAERGVQRGAQVEHAVPVRQVLGAGDRTGVVVDLARRADPDALEVGRHDLRLGRRLAQRVGDRVRDVLRAALGRRRPARAADHLVVVVDDHRLDLRAAEVDAAA
jgi:hypothetical protein